MYIYKEPPVLNNPQYYGTAAPPAPQTDDRSVLGHVSVVPQGLL